MPARALVHLAEPPHDGLQAELREQVRSYQEEKEREREVAAQLEQMKLAEEREQQLMATREIEKFRERVSVQ